MQSKPLKQEIAMVLDVRGVEGPVTRRGLAEEVIMNAPAPPVAPDRLERVLAHTGYCLREIRHTARPGALSGDLALIWRRHLGPVERCLLLATAAQAADPEDLDALLTAVQRDREVEEWPFPGVDPEMFRRVCREHRPPPLTKIEQRRADAISFDESPRATLVAAWAGASDRDRRDLVNRVTERVNA